MPTQSNIWLYEVLYAAKHISISKVKLNIHS